MGVRAGELDRRIRLERPVMAENAMGEGVPGWAPLPRVWAKVTLGSGAERREAAQEDNNLAATFTVRWSSTLAAALPSWRIVHDGVVWDIKSIAELGRREGLQATAVTRYDPPAPYTFDSLAITFDSNALTLDMV